MAAGMDAVTLSGALNREVGRRLRSQTAKAMQNVKLVDSKVTYKSKKKVTKAVEEDGKAQGIGKRAASGVVDGSGVEVSGVVVIEPVKKPRKTRKKAVVATETTVSVNTSLGKATGASEGSEKVGVQEVTVSSLTTPWSISLSSAEAIADATKHLLTADVKLGDLIGRHGQGPVFEQKGTCFGALVRSIVYQQLAGKAAAAIHGRLVGLCGGPGKVTPAVIAALKAEELREIGISGRKATYLHDLAEKFLSGFLSEEKLPSMTEDDLVTALTAVKGIGVWSAHMFMIFYLHKPDVLPVGDLAIRKGFQKLYQLKAMPSAPEMQELASCWRPYRTLASWYLWRVSDIKLPDS